MASVKLVSLLGLFVAGVECDDVTSLSESIPGVPGEDYPILATPPDTSFSCADKVNGGYYSDVEARCQVFHICAGESELSVFSFLCPNGTLFNQLYFVCDWWFNVDCDTAGQFYSLNDELDNARQASPLNSDVPKTSASRQSNSQTGSVSSSKYNRGGSNNANNRKGSGLRKSLNQLIDSNDISNSNPRNRPAPANSLQSLYGAPEDDRFDEDYNEVLSFEAEIPPAYKRPSRDLQFDYVNTARAEAMASRQAQDEARQAVKAAKEAEAEAHELLVSLVKLVSPEDLEDLYIR